jgi:hypothetical protein
VGTDAPADVREVLLALGLRKGAALHVRRGGESCIVEVDARRLALAGPVTRRILTAPQETVAGP